MAVDWADIPPRRYEPPDGYVIAPALFYNEIPVRNIATPADADVIAEVSRKQHAERARRRYENTHRLYLDDILEK